MKLVICSNHAVAPTAVLHGATPNNIRSHEDYADAERARDLWRGLTLCERVIGITAGGECSLAVYEYGLVCALGLDCFTQTGAI